MGETYDAAIVNATFEDGPTASSQDFMFNLVLAAHCLEHMADAPAAIVKAASVITPGGEFWVVVPDDSDPLNVDHLYFFTPSTLRSCLEAAGLVVEALAVRKYVKHENFIYCRARKP